MAEVNRSINIFINEAEVAASLEKMQQKAESLRERMEKAAGTEQWEKLKQQLDSTEGKITNLGRQLAGEVNPTLRQMEQTVTRLRNELKNTETGTEAFVQKTKQLAQAEQQLKKVTTEVNGVKAAMNEATKSTGLFAGMKDKLVDFARTIPGIGQAFSAMLGPVGLVVGALTALFAIITKNARVADEISFAMAGVSKVVRGLADDLVNLVTNGFNKLVAAVKSPVEALISIGTALKNAILNPKQALIDLGNAFAGFGKHVADLYQSGDKAARMFDDMSVAAANLRSEISRTNIDIERQNTIMRDGTRSNEERLKAAQKVIALETANANRRIELIDLELKAIEERNRGLELSGEEEAKMIDLRAQKLQEQANNEAAIRKATNAQAQLEAEIAAERLKNNAAIQITTITDIANNASQLVGDFAKRTAEQVKTKWSDFKDWMSGEWGQALQAGVQAVNNLISGSIAISDNLTEKKLQDIGKVFTKQQEELDRQRELNLISEEAYALKSEAIKKDQARKEAQIKRDQFIKQKAANITMAVINTALSVVNALATAPWPVNIVMAALAAATGAVQIGVIASQPVPQFAKGGKLAGPRHEQGGIPVSRNGRLVAEAEGDEWFINRDSSNAYHHVLDAINRDDAQVQWLKGFPRLNMPYAIAGGQLVMGADGLPVAAANNSELKKELKEARKTHVQAAKYMADRIVKAIETSQPRTRL